MARAAWGGAVEKRLYRHDGSGWRIDPAWSLPDEPFVRTLPGGNTLDMGVRIVSLNGDAFPDLLRARAVDGMVSSAAWVNNGAGAGVAPGFTRAPAWDLTLTTTAEHFVQPRAGRLVLFPSYMWHGTNAIQGTEPRLTIAFDAVPGPG